MFTIALCSLKVGVDLDRQATFRFLLQIKIAMRNPVFASFKVKKFTKQVKKLISAKYVLFSINLDLINNVENIVETC